MLKISNSYKENESIVKTNSLQLHFDCITSSSCFKVAATSQLSFWKVKCMRLNVNWICSQETTRIIRHGWWERKQFKILNKRHACEGVAEFLSLSLSLCWQPIIFPSGTQTNNKPGMLLVLLIFVFCHSLLCKFYNFVIFKKR